MATLIPDGFYFPRSRAEALTRVAIRTTEERARIRRIIAQEKRGTIGAHYAAELKARLTRT